MSRLNGLAILNVHEDSSYRSEFARKKNKNAIKNSDVYSIFLWIGGD
jgi:hypothetical protein